MAVVWIFDVSNNIIYSNNSNICINNIQFVIFKLKVACVIKIVHILFYECFSLKLID